MTRLLAVALIEHGYTVLNNTYFDTLTVQSDMPRPSLASGPARAMVSFSETDGSIITLSLNETTTIEKLEEVAALLCGKNIKLVPSITFSQANCSWISPLKLTSIFSRESPQPFNELRSSSSNPSSIHITPKPNSSATFTFSNRKTSR